MPAALRRSYDHRIRQAVVEAGSIDLFPALEIPDSTLRSWLQRGPANVVALADEDAEVSVLRARLANLERRVDVLSAVVRLLVTLVRVTGATLTGERVPGEHAKRRILHAIERAEPAIGRTATLRVIGLKPARLREWNERSLACALADAPPCPRSVPNRLSRDERGTIRDLVESTEYRHLSLRCLSLLAQRLGKVFASYGTWCRLVREHGWNRPRHRLYPARPRVGVRAAEPDEWWHVDVTVIRLLDGTRTYLHAVIDNFSRKVLAWTLEENLSAEGTRRILGEAMEGVDREGTKIMTDGGSENLVIAQDADLSNSAQHIVAQVDVRQSNSMVEALWRQLRHQWLYLHSLDSFAGLERLVAKYFEDHNSLIPRAELGGRTPNEAHAGDELDLAGRLHQKHADARRERIAANQAVRCGRCVGDAQAEPPSGVETSAVP